MCLILQSHNKLTKMICKLRTMSKTSLNWVSSIMIRMRPASRILKTIMQSRAAQITTTMVKTRLKLPKMTHRTLKMLKL